jgi:DnaJ-domain-containing protein 1
MNIFTQYEYEILKSDNVKYQDASDVLDVVMTRFKSNPHYLTLPEIDQINEVMIALAFGAYQENNKELLSKTKDLVFYVNKESDNV